MANEAEVWILLRCLNDLLDHVGEAKLRQEHLSAALLLLELLCALRARLNVLIVRRELV